MRRIRKTHAPASLRAWIEANRDLPNFIYEGLPVVVKRDLKEKLVEEQGFLCAYTGQGIDDATSHIEHLKPQNKCQSGEDVDYRNVVACFPRDGGDMSHGYGAPIKGGWWDEALFVSPLSTDCSRRFSFLWSGKVKPNPASHAGARETITRLGLDSRKLTDLRRAAISGFFGFGANRQRLTTVEARKLLREIKGAQPPAKLRPFCFVFEELLPKYEAAEA